jgi:hypothetical protein
MSWSAPLKLLLKAEGEKCLSYYWLHSQAEQHFSRWNTALSIPVIVLSTISGASSIGTDSIFPEFPQASLIIGFVSIGVGVLNTVQSYFGFAARSEGHRIASITYGKLHRLLSIELSLPRAERTHADQLLKSIRDAMDRLLETAPTIPPVIIARYKQRFEKEDDVSHPVETNGLDPIAVNIVEPEHK